MSQITTTRTAIVPVNRPGITQTLQPAGQTAQAPITSGQEKTARFLQSVGQGLAAGAAIVAEQMGDAEKEHEALLRGEAALAAGQEQGEFVTKIEEGEIKYGLTAEENQEIARQVIDQRGAEFGSDIMAEEYRDRQLVWLTNQLEGKRLEAAEVEKQKLDLESWSGLVGIADTDRFGHTKSYRINTLRQTEAEAMQGFVKAMQVNAEAGDQASFDAIEAFIPDTYKMQKLTARARLNEVLARNTVELNEAREDETSSDIGLMRQGKINVDTAIKNVEKRYADDPKMRERQIERLNDQHQEWETEQRIEADRTMRATEQMYIDEINRLIMDKKPGEAAERVREYVEGGKLDATRGRVLAETAEQDIAQKERDEERRQAVRNEMQIREEHAHITTDLMDRGMAPMVQDYETVIDDGTPDGRRVVITREEAIQDEVSRKMQDISSRHEDDPNLGFAKQVHYLAANGVTFEPYAETMKAGATATLIDLTGKEDTFKDGDPKINTNAVAGFDMYLSMSAVAQNKTIVNKHLDPESRAFYELAESALLHGPYKGDRKRALAMAARVMSDEDYYRARRARVDEKTIRSAVTSKDVSSWPFYLGNVKNREDLAEMAVHNAKDLAVMGIAPSKAGEMAVDNLFTNYRNINGWAVATSQTSLPDQYIVDGAQAALVQYRESVNIDALNASGTEFKDLTLAPLDRNTWVVIDGNTGAAVYDWSDNAYFTNDQIAELARENQSTSTARDKAAADAVFEQEISNRYDYDKYNPTIFGVLGKANAAIQKGRARRRRSVIMNEELLQRAFAPREE